MDSSQPPPASMADLIELDVQPQRIWRASELGAVLEHELNTPLWMELDGLRVGAAVERGIGGLRLLTVGELLHHPAPPLDLLVQLKNWAKKARHDPQSHLPEEVAAVIYALALAAGLTRHRQRLTSLAPEAIGQYLRWAAQRPWLGQAEADLLRRAVDECTSI
jgi:hypothetical protein